MIFRRAFSIPVPGLIFSAIGLVYSIFMSIGVGTEFVCLTSGCSIVEDFRLAGFSPWWLAALIFGLMTVLSVFRLRALARLLAYLLLLGDCFFLLVMIFIAPCTSCLIAAILIFCAWVALRMRPGMLVTPRRIMAGGISVIWGLLFMLNLGPVLSEFAGAKNMAENSAAKVSVYFSPSCPACLEAARFFDRTAVFYPVAEAEDDIALVADLESRMAAGQRLYEALGEIDDLRKVEKYSPPELGFWHSLSLRISLMRNQGRISRLGFKSVPVIMIEGMPRAWAGQAAGAAPAGSVPEAQSGRPVEERSASPAPDGGGDAQIIPDQMDSGQSAPGRSVPDSAAQPAAPTAPARTGSTPEARPDAGTEGTAPEAPEAADEDGFELPAELSGGTMECGPETQAPCI